MTADPLDWAAIDKLASTDGRSNSHAVPAHRGPQPLVPTASDSIEPFSAQTVATLAPLLDGAPPRFELIATYPDGRSCAMRAGPLLPNGSRVSIASVTKILFAYAVCVAVEEGTVRYDDHLVAIGADITLADALAHASGLPFQGRSPISKPRTRRIYSNTGIEFAATHLAEHSAMTADEYMHEGVFAPLEMSSTSMHGSPAHGAQSNAMDLMRFAKELLNPTLVSSTTLRMATSMYIPDLSGVLPGFGPQSPNPWGLGFEIHGSKRPHWMGTLNSPNAFGHFGQTGSFVWVDPDLKMSLVFVGTRQFDAWAAEKWSHLADAIIANAG